MKPLTFISPFIIKPKNPEKFIPLSLNPKIKNPTNFFSFFFPQKYYVPFPIKD
jgi:hypothetical protein